MDNLQTTDFFGRQESARKRTRQLLVLYATAVLFTCLAVALLAIFVGLFMHEGPGDPSPWHLLTFAFGGAACAALLIGGGTAYRISELRGGGHGVAMSLGGRIIDHSTTDPDERKVLNVVEEMAIASGVPVPPVYVLDLERGINAFAAGYSTGDAVIGVTKGCVQGLTRDELQGVMAHEFSHILNGDMRLNIRLIGLLGGIVLLSLAGYTILRATWYTPRSSRRDGKGVLLIMAVGVGLLVIGSVGSLCARIIQAAVSRQREFLADASAVQFTRNPEGIGGALRRIGGSSARSVIMNPHNREMSHLFFGNAVSASSFFGQALASHPPLPERIRRVIPTWDGTMLKPLPTKVVESPSDKPRPLSPRERLQQAIEERSGTQGLGRAMPLLAVIGTATLEHADHARALLGRIPPSLKDAAHDPYGCRAVVYSMLIHWRGDETSKRIQLGILDQSGDTGVASLVRILSKDADGLDASLRLPLIDLCLSALARLSERQHLEFRNTLHALALADGKVTLDEWALLRIIESHLDERFGNAKPTQVRYYGIAKLGPSISVLLGALARHGQAEPGAALSAFNAGARVLHQSVPISAELTMPPAGARSLDDLDVAIRELRQLAPRLKAKVLEAAALVVAHDHEVTPGEADLLRAFADLLGVPVPPLLPGQRLV
ncbi:MAG: M48 family metalloprotease [Phycisphaeraceae bacterium]|nr:M48 family metalloprotease [Phycisphaeraceae bacterium]